MYQKSFQFTFFAASTDTRLRDKTLVYSLSQGTFSRSYGREPWARSMLVSSLVSSRGRWRSGMEHFTHKLLPPTSPERLHESRPVVQCRNIPGLTHSDDRMLIRWKAALNRAETLGQLGVLLERESLG